MTVPHLPDWLQQALDRGLDPLDDPAACAWLDAHPEALESFAGLRADLAALGAASPMPRRRRRMPIGVVVASLLLLSGVAAGIVWWRASAPASRASMSTVVLRDEPLPRPDLGDDGRFVSFVTTAMADGDGAALRRVTIFGHTTARRVVTLAVARAASPSIPFHVQITRNEESVLVWPRP